MEMSRQGNPACPQAPDMQFADRYHSGQTTQGQLDQLQVLALGHRIQAGRQGLLEQSVGTDHDGRTNRDGRNRVQLGSTAQRHQDRAEQDRRRDRGIT